MEVTRTASTSRAVSSPSTTTERLPPTKRHRPDVVAPSSPTKPKPHQQRPTGYGRVVNKEQEARREASLLSFAEARARASSTYSPTDRRDAHFQYPPGYNGEPSARGLLEQIKNRMDARAPKPSNFLQKAKQVQQSLLEKQQKAADVQRMREEAARRESFRSAGFAEEPAVPSHADGYGPADGVNSSRAMSQGAASQGAFARAKQRLAESDAESDDDEAEIDDSGYPYSSHVGRDVDLALVESLRPGPRAVPSNPEDPKWELMEPFSGHRLRERKLPHSQLKEHLRGRYHIPPSLLYSVARPITTSMDANGRPMDWKALRNGHYEVPVDGDWIVIATIVEKSGVLVSKSFESQAAPSRDNSSTRKPPFSRQDDDPVLFKDAGTGANGKLRLDLEPGNSDAFSEASSKGSKAWKRNAAGEQDEEMERKREEDRLANRSRKFVVLKLVDLGVNSTQGDGTGSAGRGDNYLSLIAYESDQIDTSIVLRNTNVRSEVSAILSATASSTKKWVNGSRGAFELLYQQAEGTLVAIMNPKVHRPIPAGGKPGALETSMFRITPRSAEDCLIIGQAADYRRCSAIKANGQRCSSFVDIKARKQTRTTTCDYHLSRHMDELARDRPEFAANSTMRFGGAGGGGTSSSGARPAASSYFGGRRRGGYPEEDSAINNITTSYKTPTNNPFSRAALAKKLNSSFGNVGDGMDNNGGQVYVSQSPIVALPGKDDEVRASDPSNWKYDVSGRFGRGNTEKQARLKKQIEEEQLMRKIEARFAPPPAQPSKSKDGEEGEGEDGDHKEERTKKEGGHVLPVLPNGTADMINAAYSTLDQRKRLAQQKKEAIDAKRRKYTGVTASTPTVASSDVDSTKLKFMTLPISKRSSALVGGLPITGLTKHTPHSDGTSRPSGDSRSKLLSLAHSSSTATVPSAEPSLKIKKAHRPKLRLPSDEVGRVSKLKVVGGELVNIEDFEDDGWEDDLDDEVTRPSAEVKSSEEVGLSEHILQLQSQSRKRLNNDAEDDEDSDLEII
ncbi:related to MCM10 - essential chromatin-associated protein involved in the initiation of DNA replication [Ustilago trichophora]|uniref:Related to MCM10 - essential chromatin-associated protein involved in the initiation of DNA replication n=1 Tax=Ustilago trichophora TaxID=86804 RepID=A0A5C3EP21_9BASI|nr:related to MCM10 - essential chromatin-associated protein involved in the initiation of DNA replication [Ustilago trichophora]